MTADPIRFELTPPYRHDGKPARFQSLWLLARLHYAAAHEDGMVAVSALRQRFPASRTPRMLVSRAFADFAAWGVEVGWGAPPSESIALLNPDGRSRGPFWLSAAGHARLGFLVDGKPADRRQLELFLGLAPWPSSEPDAARLDTLSHNLDYWSQLTQAIRDERDGMGRLAGPQVAASFHAASLAARNDFQQALALTKESLAWRRSAQFDDSRLALKKLGRVLDGRRFETAQPTFAAMACIARAWDHYARGESVSAEACLGQLLGPGELQPVYRYNPRVRFECLNLGALLHKQAAIAERAPERAEAALRDLAGALEAAYEADSIDAAQHVAANLGWCLWLFWQQQLIDPLRALRMADMQRLAMRWLGLSEWICDRFGVGNGSAWNVVFLLRIARGDCLHAKRPSLAGFRSAKPFPLQDLRDALALSPCPFSAAKGYRSWAAVAEVTLEEHDQGRLPLTPLQLANLLLETLWFQAWEDGLSRRACGNAQRLKLLLPHLRRSERSFFRAEMAALPPELLESG
ncbi:hypothetical protein [Chromobacterium violaceum]|uniref:Uncharacterized protein n=1 Tax=Chromobacterium violaceum TaxID=536 RepID=A0A202B9L9_CHRVL|nr:hypothetical protein [Chromobacterium violaceum]MBA8734874.1 hypothetical protein [Chromobacterium violaceum]OVE48253.1 hypothetical protein CBW21_09785 [Chromobacterium violaceum]